MDLTLLDCMRAFCISKGEEIILTADDESDEEYRLSKGWDSFENECHRITWKYCQVSRIDVGAGYIRFWIEA